ncbi:MAG: hypothetical protein ABIZ80_04725, partial [Bryobacteraceae bacterium]
AQGSHQDPPPAGLPPEALSLIQDIKLNKAGWWESTIQKLLVNALWLQGGVASDQQLVDDLRTRCGTQATNRVRDQLQVLLRNLYDEAELSMVYAAGSRGTSL